MKVIYSQLALESLKESVDFLEQNWTEKELRDYENEIEKFLMQIEDGIIKFPLAEDLNVQYALIAKKQVKIYFDLPKNEIEILLFFPSKKNPKTLIDLLK